MANAEDSIVATCNLNDKCFSSSVKMFNEHDIKTEKGKRKRAKNLKKLKFWQTSSIVGSLISERCTRTLKTLIVVYYF